MSDNFPDVQRLGESGGPALTREQQQQLSSLVQKVTGIVKGLAGGKGLPALGVGPAPHKPILKALEDIGIPLRTREVDLDGETTVCVVIPLQQLVTKEYEYLTGINVEDIGSDGTNNQNEEQS